MAFAGTQVVVSNSTATLIAQAGGSPMAVYLRNHDGANSVFLGGDNTVTISGGTVGLELKAGETFGPVTLPPTAAIYGLAKTAAVTLDVAKVQL